MLRIASHLIPILHAELGTAPKFNAIYESYEHVIDHVRRWLRGEITDPDEVIAPLEMPDRVPFDSLELEFKGTKHFGNLYVVGSLITEALLYAGEIQFKRAGIIEVPTCLEKHFTDEELADEFTNALKRASRVMQKEFRTLWRRDLR